MSEAKERKPFEIARETLKQINARKLVPTPANYQAVYAEIAGVPVEPPFPLARLNEIVHVLPAKTPGQQRYRALLESAIRGLNWEGVKTALVHYGGFAPNADAPKQSEIAEATSAPELTRDFFEQLARLVEHVIPALGDEDDRLPALTQELVSALRLNPPDPIAAKRMVAAFSHRVSFVAEDQAEIKLTLLKLLQLIVQNIRELSLDDQWLQGQIDALLKATEPPLTLRRLDDVEHRLKDVIVKQTEAKGRAVQAQQEVREMLASFIERLSQMTASTGSYQSTLETNAKLIEQAKTLDEIAPVLREVVSATRQMAVESQAVRNELQGMREKVETSERELYKLHQELDRISAQARHDPLTGALNRKGLDEALVREIANVRRSDVPLCVALLDIDNFKRINDDLGHASGDEALSHLVSVTRDVMRPQDTIARYGGEEFVILLPNTGQDQGVEAMTRLQRELSKRLFLSGSEKVLITFSAGVAQVNAQESGDDAIKRADQAMYLAKRKGKNRVIGA